MYFLMAMSGAFEELNKPAQPWSGELLVQMTLMAALNYKQSF